MREKYIKPKIEVIKIEADDVVAISEMVLGTVYGKTDYTSEQNALFGGTVGGNTTFIPQY